MKCEWFLSFSFNSPMHLFPSWTHFFYCILTVLLYRFGKWTQKTKKAEDSIRRLFPVDLKKNKIYYLWLPLSKCNYLTGQRNPGFCFSALEAPCICLQLSQPLLIKGVSKVLFWTLCINFRHSIYYFLWKKKIKHSATSYLWKSTEIIFLVPPWNEQV